ncbi:MAG: cbb3-type cytochrome oxidase assembly protein CcoS [Chamaesiphon sp. CSU_1_12]|nr:cbb3-type cytochrome oxidase assembly protein CcoS [Chamaesiphon sp. CSU_1_12]
MTIDSVVELVLGMTEPHAPNHSQMGSWFGIGDGTVIMWSLVWVLLPIGFLALLSLVWAAKNGQFKDAQEIAERQLKIED